PAERPAGDEHEGVVAGVPAHEPPDVAAIPGVHLRVEDGADGRLDLGGAGDGRRQRRRVRAGGRVDGGAVLRAGARGGEEDGGGEEARAEAGGNEVGHRGGRGGSKDYAG